MREGFGWHALVAIGGFTSLFFHAMTRVILWVGVIGAATCGAGCEDVGSGDGRPGYTLPAESRFDLANLYVQLGEQNTCLNARSPGVVTCELFLYVPCDTTVRAAPPVSSVPSSCDATTRARTGRNDAINWCLVGPHIEPAPTGEYEGGGRAGWGGDQGWLESEFHSMDCASSERIVQGMRAEREQGHDFEAEGNERDPTETLEACFSHFCS